MNKYTIIISTDSKYRFKQINLPEDFTHVDVNDAMKQEFGGTYNFAAIYPYGPYQRLASTNLTIVLRKEA